MRFDLRGDISVHAACHRSRVLGIAHQRRMHAYLTQSEQFLQDRAVVLHDSVTFLQFGEVVLVSRMMLLIEGMLGRCELKIDKLQGVGRQIKNRLPFLVNRLLRSSQCQMSHDQLKSRHTQRISRLGQTTDILRPDGSIGKGFQSKEANERKEIVERVLQRRATQGGPARCR